MIIICPACGFSFKMFDIQLKKKVKVCPMCGHKFYDSNFLTKNPKEYNQKFF
ncbi:MAG: hypothetical protein ACFFAN_12165 [Promethearchaeota archaeon]